MSDDLVRDRQRYELLDRVLDMPTMEREAALDNLDPDLASDVRSMLAADDDSDDFLAATPVTPATVPTHLDPTPEDPVNIGPFTLLETLGEGGMGRVYLAEQTEPVRRRVALKLLRTSLPTRQQRLRFEAERQALALLEHPRICRILDAGTTNDGFPFFAMEVVEGQPITEYCEVSRCPLDERLWLMISICRGVQHAHQKQILHRDLKPSNILVIEVEGRPLPKIIDFGIAKALGDPLTGATLTAENRLIGTPGYMSPEAIEAKGDLDTRADVYSLGILLYELLVGVGPFEAEEDDLAGLVQSVLEEEPAAPSVRFAGLAAAERERQAASLRCTPRELQRRMMRDLDWIVLKALDKDRDRRYGSVAELSNDLRRCLRHEPVKARPATWGYRFAKFVRRRQLGVALGVIAIGLLTLTGIFVSRFVSQTVASEERVRQEAHASREALAFVFDLFAPADVGVSSEQLSALEILDRGVEEVRASQARPLQRARRLAVLAELYGRLGVVAKGRDLAAEALKICQSQLPGDDPEVQANVTLLADLERRVAASTLP